MPIYLIKLSWLNSTAYADREFACHHFALATVSNWTPPTQIISLYLVDGTNHMFEIALLKHVSITIVHKQQKDQ